MSSPPTAFVFPSTDSLNGSPTQPSPQRRQPLLSFRRISLPTVPSLLNRQSSASLASYDSVPEEGTSAGAQPIPKTPPRRMSNRPISIDNKARPRRRKDTLQVDENKEARRKKIITEFYDTERAYVDGLDLIYTLFLTPLIESLDTPSPLLDREDLISVFSNFVDIWNLHRSFYTSLSSLLQPALSSPKAPPPPLSPVLISHFPYLSLYTPFVTSFPSVLSTISIQQSRNRAFATFVQKQEQDPRCGKLKMRDWLLTIVQRCPRYLLLLKDLINCTDPEDQEHANLLAAHALLSKVTTSLDTSLHTHSQTLALLALQRATPNLPEQLVTPGRSLLKRGKLLQLDNSSLVKEREFLLFTDCIMWVANDRMVEGEWSRRTDALFRGAVQRPAFKRTRSKSENEIRDMKANVKGSPKRPSLLHGHSNLGIPDERWTFHGKIELVDVEVVISSAGEVGEERRLEILSPAMSFAAYADTEKDRDDWAVAIRSTKASLLVSLNVMHPNSTLAASSSTSHLRRSLQALPHQPDKDETMPKRGKVDHFVPAIWVPDGKTDICMRCGKLFGWRRRRHHCRLCGRCVCAHCSGKTFFIAESSASQSSKAARACNACYETVFPLIESSGSEGSMPPTHSASTLSSFPSLKSSAVITRENTNPSALMSLNKRPHHHDSPTKENGRGALRRQKPRPLSHPAIPQVFHNAKVAFSLPVHSEVDVGDSACGGLQDSSYDFVQSDQLSSSYESQELSLDSPNISANGNISASVLPEPTPRTRKRFSMPAISLQTTAVTARPNAVGEGQAKRFSLVLGGKHKSSTHLRSGSGTADGDGELRHGIAAAKLAELLEKNRASPVGTDY